MALFDPQNRFWQDVSRVGDVVLLSLSWALCSLPIFTLGASTAALYDSAVRCVREGQSGALSRFFRSFRDCLKPSIPVTLMFLTAEALLLWAWWVTSAMAALGNWAAMVLLCADTVFVFLPAAIWLMAMAALSRFTFRSRQLALTAFQLTFRHLSSAAFLAVLAAVCCVFVLNLPPLIMVLPCLTALFASLPLERVFAFYQSHKELDQEEQ